MGKEKQPKPGDGLMSIKTTSLFRVLNFELYAKPNKIIMGIGISIFFACLSYITYMKRKYEALDYYPGVKEDGTEQYFKKRSNWD